LTDGVKQRSETTPSYVTFPWEINKSGQYHTLRI